MSKIISSRSTLTPSLPRSFIAAAGTAALVLAQVTHAGSPRPATPPAANLPPSSPPSTTAANTFADAVGQWSNFSVGGTLNTKTPFFEAQGTNGRSCATCHVPQQAWTSTPAQLRQRFAATQGADPIFASIDGTNCPSLAIATAAEHEAASSLLLTKGLIRIALSPPAGADFTISAVSNPYGCSSTSSLSVYRRILPTTNLAFLSTVMWDGRESPAGQGIYEDLLAQATSAILTHEQAKTSPSSAVLEAIESVEVEQFTAQSTDSHAGALNTAGGDGGPLDLAEQAFTVGGNDPFGAEATTPGVPPEPVFTLYAAWEKLTGTDPVSLARASIGRGEHLFNTRPMAITGVAGINDVILANGRPRGAITGTCGTCHNAPNAGSHTSQLLVDLGLSAASLRTADLPLITLLSTKTGAKLQTTDPGYALTTGHLADVDKFKVPTLRAAAARAPYFHNGSAATLDAVVTFYNQRFNMNLLPQEHADLVAFLSAL